MLRRLIFVLRMMAVTFSTWKTGDWLSFWLGSKNTIELKGINLTLRAGNYLAKIADLAMAWEVIMDGVYDTYPIKPTDTIVDIGGHIGSFATKAGILASQGKVYACEPFPSTYEVLSKNTAPYPNIKAQQIAISNKNGTDTFYFSTANPAENSLVRKSANSTEVPLMTLGDFLTQNNINSVDLMKVDCEGAEYDILFGAKDQLHKIKKMVMEIHEPEFFGISDRYSITALTKFLEESGFKVTFKRENKFQGYIYAHR
jgi:FkbM family methyltransferase